MLTVAIGIIIIIELKIMYETTQTYNESLVNQLSEKNKMLEDALLNLSMSNNDRNELFQKLLKLTEEMRAEAENRTDELEDKIEETQGLIIQMTKENKLMYGTGEENFGQTMKMVREALTMNTNTVIRLLDENSAIQSKLHSLEEPVAPKRNGRREKFYSDGCSVGRWSSGLISLIGFFIFFSS